MNLLPFIEQPDAPQLPALSGAQLPAAPESVQMQQNRDRDRLIWAAKNPRNIDAVLERITKGCQRESFAQIAVWEKPVGGQLQKGPSIRLAELIAKNYGNFDTGSRTLPEKSNDKQTTIQVYAWDLETNYSHCIEMTVEHRRAGRKAQYENNIDEVYKILGANISKKVRDCIFKVVEADIKDIAYGECLKTLSRVTNLAPSIDRLRLTFDALGISQAELENYMGKALLDFTSEDIGKLRVVYGEINNKTMSIEEIKNFKRQPVVEAEPVKEDEPAAKGKKGKKDKAEPAASPAESEPPIDVTPEPVDPPKNAGENTGDVNTALGAMFE